VHLVAFIIGMYHDARFSECQTRLKCVITPSQISFSVTVHKQLCVPWRRNSSRPPTKEDNFPFQASSCRICSGQSATVVVSLRVLLFLPSVSFLKCFIRHSSFTHIRAYIILAASLKKTLLSLPQWQNMWFLFSVFQPFVFVNDVQELGHKCSQVIKFGSFYDLFSRAYIQYVLRCVS